jgi:thiol-disulfide isomerase/thioredoxin
MGFFNRNFFAGMAVGIALTVIAGIGSLVVVGYLILHGEGLEVTGAPVMPDLGNLQSYGQPDADWTVKGLDGKAIRLGDLRGRPIFVNIWATWCGPCVREMPAIGNLYAALHDQGVEFLVVSEEDEETVRRFVSEENLPFPVYISTENLPSDLETSGIPATFILDGTGTIVFKRTGAAKWDAEPVRNFLLALRTEQHPFPAADK